jgi:hypothetical protein
MLDARLTVSPAESALQVTLDVENEGDDAVSMQFSDGQRAEFVAEDADSGDEVWRWSSGRMFSQALGSVDLDPGQSASFEGGWQDPPAGEYLIRGWLVANDVSPDAEMTVEIE